MAGYSDPMTGAPNVPDWEEDGKISVTGVTLHSYTLEGSYDWVAVLIRDYTNTSGTTQPLRFDVKGSAGSYNDADYLNHAGTETAGAFRVPLASGIASGAGVSGILTFKATWSDTCAFWANMGGPAGELDGVAGELTGISSPVQSIRFYGTNGSGDTFDLEATVLGWNE